MTQTPLNIQLDFRSKTSITTQIVEQIQRMVAQGDLKQGDQLPTVRQLAAELRVSLNTVARAYQLLDEARLISTQRGRGTYIWEAPSDETLTDLRLRGMEGLARKFIHEALALGFGPAEIAAIINQTLAQWDQESQGEPTEE